LVAGGCSNDPIIEGVWQTHPEVAEGNAWTTSGVYEDPDQLLRRITPFPEELPDLRSIPFGCDTEQIQERLAPELLAARLLSPARAEAASSLESSYPASYEGMAGPVGRVGQISDVVDAILYLERATFVTGETLHIDGGQAAGH
jgi:hypothetical protein